MKKLFFLIILAACVYGVLSYHFILMDSSLKVLKKTHMTLDDTFVDARGPKKAELILNPALLKAGLSRSPGSQLTLCSL